MVLIFVTLLLSAIYLYARGFRVLALIIFSFFLTSGFNLIPEELMDTGLGISKGVDYAFFILLGFLVLDGLCVENYFKPDAFLKWLLLFYAFLLVCCLYSKFSVGLSWPEIIRTSRYHFFWMGYLVFRNMEKSQIEELLKSLFTITVFLSIVYLCQHFFETNLLVERSVSSTEFLGLHITRYYNQPDMLHFFAFVAIFANPFTGRAKRWSTVVLIIALLIVFHRSLIGFFIFALFVGYCIRLPKIKRIRIFIILLCALLTVGSFAWARFVHSRTYIDLKTVLSGDVVDAEFDLTDLKDATFSFRIGHMVERIQYLSEHPVAQILGAGLIPEDSRKVDQLFDFKIGLLAELTDQTIQLETSDISYSVLFIRLGYLGTLLNLSLFIFLMVFFYKNKNNKYAFSSFLFLVLSFGTSFFSGNLLMPVTFILPLMHYNLVKKMKEMNA